jgi:hypothetical protein
MWRDVMPVRPVEYHPFQYPRKYRPLGYGSWEPPAPPSEPASGHGGRRFVALILAALLATIVIHVGIAVAYDGGGRSDEPNASTTNVTAPAENSCDTDQDPFADPEFQDVGDPGDGTGPGSSAPDDILRQRL